MDALGREGGGGGDGLREANRELVSYNRRRGGNESRVEDGGWEENGMDDMQSKPKSVTLTFRKYRLSSNPETTV